MNNVYHTNDENDMWMFLLPTQPEKAEICINFKSAYGLGAIRIWNYNVESKDENNKGIKDINLYLNKSLIFNGTIFPGKGKPEDDYCTTIFLVSLGYNMESRGPRQFHDTFILTELLSCTN